MKNYQGFSLIELAIVMLILAFLLSSAFMSISALKKSSRFHDAKNKLTEIQNAIYGFAIAYNRLPCPAIPGNGAQANPLNPAEDCANANNIEGYIGFVPSGTLGISGAVNCDGLLIDPWGRPYRYSVSMSDAGRVAGGDFITANGIKNEGMENVTPNLRICRDTREVCSSASAAANIITRNAVAIIFSMGEPVANSNAENENAGEGGRNMASGCGLAAYALGNDTNYISSPIIETADGHYDDTLVWISHTILFNKLLEARHLP